jgi:hypothetical protein
MIPRPGRPAASPPIIRRFDFNRFHEQLIERAYHALIPAVRRPLGRPRSRPGADVPVSPMVRGLPFQAGGA